MMDASESAYSFPVAFDIGEETCLIELSLHQKNLKLSLHNLQNMEDEPQALCQPLRVQVHSMSSSIALQNEYIITSEDINESGVGLCCMPDSPEIMKKALVEGVVCMVSLADVTLPEGTLS